MFCPGCGKELGESDAFCRSCGRSLSENKPVPTESGPGNPVAAAAERPEEPPRRSGEATASLVLGLFSFIPVIGLLAVIFGHMARGSIRRSGGRLLGEGMAGVGLVLGYFGLAGWAIYGLTLVVHPFLPSTQRADNEQIAVESLKSINTAAIAYITTYNYGYPPNLAALGPPKTDDPSASVSEVIKRDGPNAAGLIDEMLAAGETSDYCFTYTPGKRDAHGSISTYTIHADPVTPGVSGDKYYFTDESDVIRFSISKEATADSWPIGDP